MSSRPTSLPRTDGRCSGARKNAPPHGRPPPPSRRRRVAPPLRGGRGVQRERGHRIFVPRRRRLLRRGAAAELVVRRLLPRAATRERPECDRDPRPEERPVWLRRAVLGPVRGVLPRHEQSRGLGPRSGVARVGATRWLQLRGRRLPDRGWVHEELQLVEGRRQGGARQARVPQQQNRRRGPQPWRRRGGRRDVGSQSQRLSAGGRLHLWPAAHGQQGLFRGLPRGRLHAGV